MVVFRLVLLLHLINATQFSSLNGTEQTPKLKPPHPPHPPSHVAQDGALFSPHKKLIQNNTIAFGRILTTPHGSHSSMQPKSPSPSDDRQLRKQENITKSMTWLQDRVYRQNMLRQQLGEWSGRYSQHQQSGPMSTPLDVPAPPPKIAQSSDESEPISEWSFDQSPKPSPKPIPKGWLHQVRARKAAQAMLSQPRKVSILNLEDKSPDTPKFTPMSLNTQQNPINSSVLGKRKSTEIIARYRHYIEVKLYCKKLETKEQQTVDTLQQIEDLINRLTDEKNATIHQLEQIREEINSIKKAIV